MTSFFNYPMIGGGNCTLCGSPGTNKSTCPLNPAATNPNPEKHPLAAKMITKPSSLAPIKQPVQTQPKTTPTPKPTPLKTPGIQGLEPGSEYSRCSLCGSEFTTKASCPLNPDAKPNPWKVGGVTGERGNPLKHPNAVEILRKEQMKSMGVSEEILKKPATTTGNKAPKKEGPKSVPEFVTDNIVFYRHGSNYSREYEPFVYMEDGLNKGAEGIKPFDSKFEETETNWIIPRINFRITPDNIEAIKKVVPNLTPIWDGQKKSIWFVGHYNKAGNLAYVSLHGADESSGYLGENHYQDGFVAEYNGRLYTFRRADYAWYPLESEETKWDYLKASNMGTDNQNLDFDKYLIVHTIKSDSPDTLPRNVDIKKIGIDNLHYMNQPLIGPRVHREVLKLFQDKFVLPVKYRSGVLSEKEGIRFNRTGNVMKTFLQTLAAPEKDRKFDLSGLQFKYKALCSGLLKDLKEKKASSINELVKNLQDVVMPLFLRYEKVNKKPESFKLNLFMSHNKDIPLKTVKDTEKRWYSAVVNKLDIESLSDTDKINFVGDICSLFARMMEPEHLYAADMYKYQTEFEEIMAKYNLLVEPYYKGAEAKKLIKKKAMHVRGELLSTPPILSEGSILYPGGQDYIEAMSKFPGIGKEAWTNWCYTMLDAEYKDDLIAYAKTLGLNFTKANPKSEICLAILENKQKAQDILEAEAEVSDEE